MTKEELKKNGGRMASEFKNQAMVWSIRTFFSVLAFVIVLALTPVGKQAVEVWNTPQMLREEAEERRKEIAVQVEVNQEILESLHDLKSNIRVLQQPEQVFELSLPFSGPLDGYCVEREPCELNLRMRRLLAAIDCEIVPNSVQWGFINPRAATFITARRLDVPSGRNIGLNWEDIPVTILTPPDLEPEAEFTFRAAYTNCPGTLETDEPIFKDAPRDLYRIYATEPER